MQKKNIIMGQIFSDDAAKKKKVTSVDKFILWGRKA